MKIYQADFITGAAKNEQFPKTTLPEFAFIGRSNVGKSSLLNSIVHRKNLAKVSSTPGKTKEINFFEIEGQWVFADLPGFGYAVTDKGTREKWSELNYSYLGTREQLKLTCVLVDIRHEAQKIDLGIIEWLQNSGNSFIIILTKADKINKELQKQRKQEFEYLVQFCDRCHEVLPYSSKTGMGREELLGIIKKYGVQ